MRRHVLSAAQMKKGHFPVRPWLSLVLDDTAVNKELETVVNRVEKDDEKLRSYSSPNSSLKSSKKLMRTTIAAPPRPKKNKKTSTRIANVARNMDKV
jgi:hypothetical protein